MPLASHQARGVARDQGAGDAEVFFAAEQTLGILSLQRYDGARDQVKMLAFEAFGQSCLGAVWPDSDATAFDKRNLRDGHYPIWGYLWAIGAGADGVMSDARAERFAAFLAGSTPINGADPVIDAAAAGAVPACAMQVRRAYDGAPLEAFEHPTPCGCAFEYQVAVATSCAACDDATPCAEGTCRFGFCEVR